MNYISMNVVTLLYLVASVCFIQALKGLSSPSSARMGNTFGMAGMAIAAVTTVALIFKLQAEFAASANGARGGMGFTLVLLGVVVGGAIGAYAAKKVEMTKMPELVAAMHSLIGLAAVCIAIAAVSEPWAFNIAERGRALPFGNRLELFIGTFVGAVTFSGSVIAFGKLSGKYKFRLFQGAPVRFKGQHILNLIIAIAIIALGLLFCFSDAVEPAWTQFAIMAACRSCWAC
jgi:NAD(P) transhydrogenase subunit beta